MSLNKHELQELQKAKGSLENPGFVAKVSNQLGKPIEKLLANLPDEANKIMFAATESALEQAMNAALFSMEDVPKRPPANLRHKMAASATGGVGGLFGIAGLSVELPISTTIMLRSIVDIARSEGESIHNPDTKAACLKVFALGGSSKSDNAADSAYYAVRIVLAQHMTSASRYFSERAVAVEGAPALARILSVVAQRFGIQVSQKVAAQAVPAIGAAGGALINYLFIGHFQEMARGHFTVRRLERRHGKATVEAEYRALQKLNQRQALGVLDNPPDNS